MQNEVKVGDVVVWPLVPDGALVKDEEGWHALRMRGRGVYVGEPGCDWLSADPWDDAGRWRWATGGDGNVTIIALNLTGQETATDLQRLAEIFEVREVVGEQFCDERWSQWCAACDQMGSDPWSFNEFTERLHTAGWRPGMTAEDAARLLAEAGR